jgi:hypothetical protein
MANRRLSPIRGAIPNGPNFHCEYFFMIPFIRMIPMKLMRSVTSNATSTYEQDSTSGTLSIFDSTVVS